MILIQDNSSICNGIINSLNTIYDIYEKNNNQNIYIYKNIINNKQVINELEDLNIHIIDDLDILTNNDILIINSYGVSKEVLNYLKDNNIQYVDTQCKNIKNFYEEIINTSLDTEILILDNKYSNIISNWCSGKIIKDLNDLNHLDKKKDKLLVGYAYFNNELVKELVDSLTNSYPNSKIDVLIYNCPYHKKRQELINENKLITKIMISEEEENIKNSYTNYNDFINYVLNSNLKIDEDITLIGSENTTIKELYNYKYLLSFLLFYKKIKTELVLNQEEFNNNFKKDNNELMQLVLNDLDRLNKDGKYIRGVLIALGEYFAKDKIEEYQNLAYIYELFQTSILIHDDIIDNAKLRRGKATIPHQICNNYLNNQNNKEYHLDTLKLANSLGICAGDYGFYLVNKLLINYYSKHSNFINILSIYNDIVLKTIKGEIIDVYLPYLNKYQYKESSEEDILTIYELKTSYYTVIGPFLLGYLLANKTISSNIETILKNIGIIFQIKDDIIGIYGNEIDIGKSISLDIEEFKQTLIYSYIIKTEYKEEFLKLYGSKLTVNNLNKIKYLLNVSGTLTFINNYLEDLTNDTINLISDLDLVEEKKDILKGLLIYVGSRER